MGFGPSFGSATTLAGTTPSAAGLSVLSAANAAAQAALLGVIANTAFEAYAAGTAYSVTNAAAAVVFGTTSPSITITTAGTYRIRARLNLKYNAATTVAIRTVTAKLRRTNNTAADLTSGSVVVTTAVVTTLTQTMMQLDLPEVVYVTALATDVVTIFISMDVVPSAGTLDVGEAEIHAVRTA